MKLVSSDPGSRSSTFSPCAQGFFLNTILPPTEMLLYSVAAGESVAFRPNQDL